MLQPFEEQYALAGYITRPHGIKGEVHIASEGFAPQLFDEINLAWIQNSRGDLIPARVESARVQARDNRLSFFVKFEHIADRNQAEGLKGLSVFVKRSDTRHLIQDTEAAPGFSGYLVVDEQGIEIGTVTQVLDNPAHPILEISLEEQGVLLVPLVDEYVSSVNDAQSVITCRNLKQLKDESS